MTGLILLILASIGAIIGWVTNLLAVKLLFRPFEPIQIPFIGFEIQGLIPKRRGEIARSIGQTVESDLLSVEEIMGRFVENQNKEEILLLLKSKIHKIVGTRLPSIIPSAFRDMIGKYIDDMIDQEGDRIIDEITEDMVKKAAGSIKIADMIEERVNNFELDKLEAVVLNIAKKELKHIEILGGVLGFVIGLIQGIIILLL